jgi:hypothetical protein
LPIEASKWFGGFENKEGVYIFQHPDATFIKIIGEKGKKITIKDYKDNDYSKKILVEFEKSLVKQNNIILKVKSNNISNYEVYTKDKKLNVKDKVITAVINIPKEGELISNPADVKGKIAVFEGSFIVRIIDATGKVLKEERLQTAGAPTWGEFDSKIKYNASESKNGKIEIGEYSAKDGAYIKHAQVNIKLSK